MSKHTHVRKHSGISEAFSREKLQQSLQHTCLSPHACFEIADEISQILPADSTSEEIFTKTEHKVQEKSKLAAVQYSLKRSLFDLGPEGHNFEIFVSNYFREKGYETIECVTLEGLHVKHEVDVIAKKGKETLYVECKFHNHLGVKNDVKVTLYVKARWDDLRAGPNGKHLTGFCLASNTSFTIDALTYGKGTGLRLMGVNAPSPRSFLDEVKDLKLYPVTSLTTIDKIVKKEALANKIILARDLLDQQDFLHTMGHSESDIRRICEEICFLTKESCEDNILGCH